MEGKWIREPSEGVTVVFVHGILSSAEDCWKHKNGNYWPDLLKDEPDFQNIGIYVYSYQTGFFSGTYSLNDVVTDFKERLFNLDEVIVKQQKIIFVCHSMGGIVSRKLLVERFYDFQERQIQVGLFLVASPSLGSDYANFGKLISYTLGNSQAKILRFSESNDWLNDLHNSFKNIKDKLGIIGKELVEDKPVYISFLPQFISPVVKPFSAAQYFPEYYKVPNTDHFSIAKPENAKADQHRQLIVFLKRFISSTTTPANNLRLQEKNSSIPVSDELEKFRAKFESLLKENFNTKDLQEILNIHQKKSVIETICYLTIELKKSIIENEYLAQAWLNGEKKYSEDRKIFISVDIELELSKEEKTRIITLNQFIQELIDEVVIGKPIIEFFIPQNLMYYHFDKLIYDDEAIGANFKVILRSLERVKRKEEKQPKKKMNLCFENWMENWNRVENKIHENFNNLEWLKESESDEIRDMIVSKRKVCFAFDFQLSKTHNHLKEIIKGGAIAAIWSCSCGNMEFIKSELKPFLDEANIITLPEKIYEFRCKAKKACVTLFLDTPDRLHPEQLNPNSLQIPS
jgi:hypothetical protein